MLNGHLQLDVPVNDPLGEIMGANNCIGIEIHPKDLKQDPLDPTVYTMKWPHPAATITVKVLPNGSTTVSTVPPCTIFENTLQA